MPFKKGNQLWKKGLEARNEKREKIDLFMATLAGGGMVRYAEIMDKLADGEELTKAEAEYMDRLEGWREFVRPKLARSEHSLKAKVQVTGIKYVVPDGDNNQANSKAT